VGGLKHQKEKRSMDHFAGLDVSVKDTSVCIVDDTGKIIREESCLSLQADRTGGWAAVAVAF
jgi:predicted NBD/HSP70 family sugar kinase